MRNKKPSGLVASLLVASMLFIGCRMTQEGKYFVKSLAYEAANREIAINQYEGRENVNTQGEVQRPSSEQRTSHPIFFNSAKKIARGVYEDKRDVFYPGDTINVVAKNVIGKVTNFCIALDKNEQIPKDLVNGSDEIKVVFKGIAKPGWISSGVFDSSYLLENYGNNFRTYWLSNDKIVGYRDFVIMNERPDQYSSK